MQGGNVVLLTQLHWPTVHPALQEKRPVCGRHIYKWDGEYELECILPKLHETLHFDGVSWFNDDNEFVDAPCST